jgi:hypothetical protein
MLIRIIGMAEADFAWLRDSLETTSYDKRITKTVEELIKLENYLKEAK